MFILPTCELSCTSLQAVLLNSFNLYLLGMQRVPGPAPTWAQRVPFHLFYFLAALYGLQDLSFPITDGTSILCSKWQSRS